MSCIEEDKFASKIHQTKARALVLPRNPSLQNLITKKGIAWVSGYQPRLLFAQSLRLFYQPFQPSPIIHPTAVIAPEATIGKDIYIGANVVIHRGVKIGVRTCIHPNVVIAPDVEIGENTILHPNCTIYERSKIGSHCVIHSSAVIGADAFIFEATLQGWYKMYSSGYVVLEDGVEVGCNSTIERPGVGETCIGKNTKLGSSVVIAHNCQTGENCALIGQVGLAGDVKLGNRVVLAGQVGITNQAQIGDDVIATPKTSIFGDVQPGAEVSGSPAVDKRLYLKISAIYKRLPEMYEVFKKLKKNFFY